MKKSRQLCRWWRAVTATPDTRERRDDGARRRGVRRDSRRHRSGESIVARVRYTARSLSPLPHMPLRRSLTSYSSFTHNSKYCSRTCSRISHDSIHVTHRHTVGSTHTTLYRYSRPRSRRIASNRGKVRIACGPSLRCGGRGGDVSGNVARECGERARAPPPHQGAPPCDTRQGRGGGLTAQ